MTGDEMQLVKEAGGGQWGKCQQMGSGSRMVESEEENKINKTKRNEERGKKPKSNKSVNRKKHLSE